MSVEDRPGVMAEIASVLARHQISIASVIQHEREEESHGAVPLVIMTHVATEGAMTAAIDEMIKLRSVRPGSVRMRVRN
jgi:homoserine dehydrogenase